MEIRHNSGNMNFKAVKVSTLKNNVEKFASSIDLYKLDKSDSKFLEKFEKNDNIKKFCTNLDTLAVDRWQHIFEYCVKTAKNNLGKDYTTYLAICNNKPCGILTYKTQNKELYLDGICSIPVEKNHKIPFVGKALFLQFFSDFQNLQAQKRLYPQLMTGLLM